MTDASIAVHLFGASMGELVQGDRGARWHASDQALERHGFGSRVLSVALPLDAERADVAASEAFFGGLLPEGPRLEALIRETPGASRTNLVSLLGAAGRDAVGAVVLPGPAITALGPRLSDADAALEVANPAAYVAGGGSGLPGLRAKVALARADGAWHAARDGHPSSHIIKPAEPAALRDAHSEVWAMRLARTVGLVNFEVGLEWFGEIPAVVVERFDRVRTADGFERLHQEDTAQALALPWGGDAKFEWAQQGASLRAIAALLDRDRTVSATGPTDRERLLEVTVFRLLVGDTDGHAKNHSLLHDEHGGVRLAPPYDVTPVALYGRGGDAVALFVDGKRRLGLIGADALVAEARAWGLDEDLSRAAVERVAHAVREAARELKADATIVNHLPGYVTQACRALLDGKPVGLGLGEFPTLRPLEVV
jgi:serine/threonine-protein kinase HipA